MGLLGCTYSDLFQTEVVEYTLHITKGGSVTISFTSSFLFYLSGQRYDYFVLGIISSSLTERV